MLTWPEARLGLEILASTCLCHFLIFNINVIHDDSDDWVMIHFGHVLLSESWLAAIILLGYNALSIAIVFLVRVGLAMYQRKRLLKVLETDYTAEEIWRLRRDRGLALLRKDADFRLLYGAYCRAIGHGTTLPMPSTGLDEIILHCPQLNNSVPFYPNNNKRDSKTPPFPAQHEMEGQRGSSATNTSSYSDDDSWSGISTSGPNSIHTDTATILTSIEKADTQPAFPTTRRGHSFSPVVQSKIRPSQSQEGANDVGLKTSVETPSIPGKRRKRMSSMSPEQKGKESARKTAQKKRKLQAAKMNPNN